MEDNEEFRPDGTVPEGPVPAEEEITETRAEESAEEETEEETAKTVTAETAAPEAQPEYAAGETYEWNGEKFVKAKKKKGLKAFAVCVCLALVAVCVAFALVLFKGGAGQDRVPEDPGQKQEQQDREKPSHYGRDKEAVSGSEASGEEKTEHDFPSSHSTVIRPSDASVMSMADLYEKCAPACCTIYVPVSGGAVLGSGFVVDAENGYVVTNHHVIERAGKTITVKFYDGRQFGAVLVGSDEATDIAVLRIEAEGLTELPLGDSSIARVGDPVIAIGTPYSEDLAGTLTNGMISGVDRKFEVKDVFGRVQKIMKLIQTNAAINSGNSGGPLINMQGQVIGINVMKLIDEYEGLGFAIPMSSAVTVINNLIEYGKVVDQTDLVITPAKLGITASALSPNDENLRAEYELPENLPEGVLVLETSRSTAVYKAGMRNFDIITEFDGVKIEKFDDLKAELGRHSAGDTVTLKFYRFETGEEKTIEFTLEK